MGADRVRIEPARFELEQSMVWPFRVEAGLEAVLRGKNLMPLPPDARQELKPAFTLRLVWPATPLAVSILWDELRLPTAALTLRSNPSRAELTIGPGRLRTDRPVSWWVEIRDGGGERTTWVVDYDPAWPEFFNEERAKVMEVLGDKVAALEHGGSTSVPGLAAKPVIDMWAALSSPLDRRDIEAMAAMGYEYLGEAALEDRDFFVKKSPRAFNLHCYPAGHPDWDRHISFRDWLRTHPEGADAYARLKRDLAERFPADRVAYTEAKTDFIESALSG